MPDEVVAGRYRLERRLGSGGMSEVWAGEDLELGRAVALKLLGPAADPARFEREARAAAALSHPNVTQLFDYGKWKGQPYMVLELLPGGMLEDRLRDGQALPDAEAAQIANEVAAGLAHAHERRLVHRDLKPANVLFDVNGRAKIADFGIARMGGAGTLTEAGTLLGTAAYISPEQATGEPATTASDVYSFGVILFRMLTGRLPFTAEEPIELVALHRDAPPPPVSTFRPDAPPELARVVDACLVKDPRSRPSDGSALLAALGGAPSEAETATVILPPRPRSRPQPRVRVQRRRLAALLLALLAAVGAGVAFAVLETRSSAPTTTRRTTRSTTSSTSTSTSTTTSTSSSSTSTSTTSATTTPTTTRPTTRPATTTRPTTRSTTTAPTTVTTTASTGVTTTATIP